MKLIIAGSRSIKEELILPIVESMCNYIERTVHGPSGFIDEVVSGGCRGSDRAGETFANQNEIKLTIFEAKWDEHGRSAGPLRNQEMAKYADALLLIWDGQSKGSASMKKEMQKLNKPIYEIVMKIESTIRKF